MQLKQSELTLDNWQNSTSDIAFLLMIFFILTTLWGTPHLLSLTSSSVQENVTTDEIVNIFCDKTNVTFNGDILTLEELGDKLEPTKKYKISIDNNASYQQMINVLQVFWSANITTVEINTDETQ